MSIPQSHTSHHQRRPAATFALVGGQLILSAGCLFSAGCQSPWRLWRKDEPTIEQLLAAPQPWDAETSKRAGSNINKPAINKPTIGKAAPGGSPNYKASQREPVADESAEDDLEKTLVHIPPELRDTYRRQVEAARALASREPDIDSRGSEEPSASSKSRTSGKKSDAPRVVDNGETSGATVYKLSDDDGPVEDPTEIQSLDKNAKPIAKSSRNTPRQRDGGAVLEEMQLQNSVAKANDLTPTKRNLRDSSDAPTTDRVAASRSRSAVEDVPPPSTKKSSRQIPHADPQDTGLEDESLAVMAVHSQHQPSDVALASVNTTRQAEAKAVSPASAQSKSASPDSKVVSASPNSASKSSENAERSQASSAQPANWRDGLRETLRLLDEEERSAQNEQPAQRVHRQAVRRLLLVGLGELDPALQPVEGMQPHEQEYLRHNLQATYNAIDPNGNPVATRRWALVMDSMRQAMTHLSAVSNLEVKNAAFCTNVEGYGAITKFPTTQFKPNGEVLLYCEVDNFVSELVKDGYETKLQGSYEIVDASGARVADVLLPQEVDLCKRPRRDYFFVYRIYMPQTIAPGKYQLRLTIEDMKGRKYGQSSVDFQIVP